MTATDAHGNKFALDKLEDSDATETIRFKSMYVKGGAHPSAARRRLLRVPRYLRCRCPDLGPHRACTGPMPGGGGVLGLDGCCACQCTCPHRHI